MSVDYGEHSTGLSRELRILAYILLAFAVYTFARGVYNIVDVHVWPRLFADPQRPFIALPWPYALFTVFSTALTVTLAGLAFTWVKAGQSRGWWLSGALCTQMIIGSCLGIAQMILIPRPPDNLPLYKTNPEILVQGGLFLILGITLLVYLCREAVMKPLSIETEKKTGKVVRLFFYGFLLRLVHWALLALTTWSIAVFLW